MRYKKFYIVIIFFLLTSMGGYAYMKNALVSASEYPNKPITMIVPYSAGGSIDMTARMIQKGMAKHFNQSVVILNKTGGAGTVGWNELAGSNPDGYTIGFTNIDITWQPLNDEGRYNYVTALQPLAQTAAGSMVISVLTDQPWQNINDLIEYTKEHPGEIKYGHPGIGTTRHILGEMFIKATDVDIMQVPFSNGESEALAAFLGGHVKLLISSPALIKEFVKEGKVRVLAVSDETRLSDPVFKNIPTLKEQGVNVALTSCWDMVAIPKEVPKDVKIKLAKELEIVINDPEFKEDMKEFGLTVKYLGPEDCTKKWITDHIQFGNVIKELGIAQRN
ncbi:Bug family tripartite tricarboxylate transporter substrate binding protein [Pelosinus baikalensis]|uniref:Tripartite tricarboxylate transporter substrate binding protein n=1 Tax=Pelosinus baikalensis TaxID=2892015 RepID=A0ABS8HS03_9FIRM|nr:tripartite tricarboxylate transporter substrate binding protein [Pelosinus baikalensis]MCC5465386.1 tripartite tricarboxylate transporter substrate binding protein [Pelosinus baikalensis]